jgi:hypothetical protein
MPNLHENKDWYQSASPEKRTIIMESLLVNGRDRTESLPKTSIVQAASLKLPFSPHVG